MIGTKDLLHVILLMGGRADANHVVCLLELSCASASAQRDSADYLL